MDCKKCFKALHTCQECKGYTSHNCSACNNTRLVCPEHKGFHGR